MKPNQKPAEITEENVENNEKTKNHSQENEKDLKPSQKTAEILEENIVNKEKNKKNSQENKKDLKPIQKTTERIEENIINNEENKQKTTVFPENQTPEKDLIPIEKPQSNKKNFKKSQKFPAKDQKSQGKLVIDLTKKTYKNNLIDFNEEVEKTNEKTPEKKSNEFSLIENKNLHSKEITLQEYDPNFVKRTISKLTAHIEENNQEKMTEKKRSKPKAIIDKSRNNRFSNEENTKKFKEKIREKKGKNSKKHQEKIH